MGNVIQGFVTQTWEVTFEADLEVSGYTLNNGVRIPLPGRGKMWPKRTTIASFARIKSRNAEIAYRILLVPQGHDAYWARKFLTEQAAESALSKVGTVLIGGFCGAFIAGAATIFVPSDGALTFMWGSECSEGAVYGVTSGFNV